MSINPEILESSFAKIKPQAADVANSFYDSLFTAHPEARPLFGHTDMPKQKQKLIASLVFVVENTRNPEALSQGLKGLGARHVQYGALPEHYPWVGEALLKALELHLGEEWTPEVKQAWVEAYGAITQLMLSGAEYPEEILNIG